MAGTMQPGKSSSNTTRGKLWHQHRDISMIRSNTNDEADIINRNSKHRLPVSFSYLLTDLMQYILKQCGEVYIKNKNYFPCRMTLFIPKREPLPPQQIYRRNELAPQHAAISSFLWPTLDQC
eukprot:scaffold234874_cov36-Prasinocladus_malaysianus.AAC.1